MGCARGGGRAESTKARAAVKATRSTRGFFFGVAAAVVTVLAMAGDKEADESPLDKETYQAVMAGEAHEPGDLLKRYDEARWLYLPILPPDPDFVLHQPIAGPVVPFEWKNFPSGFNEGLLARWENTVPVFDLTLAEDPLTRETVFYNGLGAPIWRIAPEPGYDPWSFQRSLSPLALSGDMSADAFYLARRLWDPARLQGRLTLIRPEHVEYYLYAAAKIAEAGATLKAAESEPEAGGMMMMLLGDPEFEFSAIARLTNGLQLTVTFPSEFTNRMDIFSSTNLVGFSWQVAASTLSTTGGSPLVWTDTSFPSTWRVYAAGDADLDSDSDGLANAREFFVYGSCPTNLDTDADGLVDGYSGVVSTNSYSAGVHSNGNGYVEGELSWGTSALLGDTDDDGVSDGDEVAGGTDPLDPDHPPNAGGTVSYSGQQTGTVVVVAVLASNDWSRTHSASNSAPGAYRVGGLSSNVWYLKAYRDSNGNGTNDVHEAAGEAAGNPVLTTNRACGIDIALEDPDSDEDGLPDWWEMEYWTSLEESGNEDDPDEDGYLNEDEYYAGTDPTDADSHPWDVSGLVTYTGAQTGTVYVVGLNAAGDIVASTVADAAGYYRMCRLPVGGEYDIRAFLDSDCTTTQDFGEAWAQWPSTLVLTQDVADVDLELSDPDTDGDGLPDYWEVLYDLDPLNGGAADACAWWKLDETSGTNVFDSTEGASTGTVQNATAPAWTNGVLGGALLFDGVDDVVTVPDGDWVNPIYVTVSFWLRAEAAPTNVAFVSKKDPGAASGYEVGCTNGQLRFAVGASSEKALLASCTLTNGGWYHVAAVYGGATQSLYLNGVRVALTNHSLGTSMGEMGASTNILTLGAAGPAAARPFAGMLDDVRIYPSELSSNAVVAIWQLGQDVDGDGLGAAAEFAAGGSPDEPDSDFDDLDDAAERNYGTSLTDSDTDHDGLSDWQEIREIGSSALVATPVKDLTSSEVEVEYKSVRTHRQKCGFGSFVATNPPVFYLQDALSPHQEAFYWPDFSSASDSNWYWFAGTAWSQSVNPTNAQIDGTGAYSSSDSRYEFDGTSSWIYVQVDVADAWTNANSALWGEPASAAMPDAGHWGTSTTVRLPGSTTGTNWTCGGTAFLAFTCPPSSGLPIWSNTVSALELGTYQVDGEVPYPFNLEASGYYEWSEGRTVPFTTPMLENLATGDLARTAWEDLDWGDHANWEDNEGPAIYEEWQWWEDPQEWVARRWMSTDEVTLDLARLLYRIRVLNPTNGTVYRMTACHLQTDDGASVCGAVLKTNYVGLYTGESSNFYLTAGTVIEPPSNNASIRVDWPAVSLWSVDGLRTSEVGLFTAVTNPHSAGRIFVDTTEEWDGGGFDTNQFNKQRIVLTAVADLKGMSTNVCRIRWAVYDPDDPATNVYADKLGVAGGDNTGTDHEGAGHWFTTNGSMIYAWDNVVSGQPGGTGVLRETADSPVVDLGNDQLGATVILNLSDDGGDNFRVRAHLAVLGETVAGDTGGLWTMWRKRFLVVDAMVTSNGLGIHYPADQPTLSCVQDFVHAAYANTNLEHACYLDIVASTGKTNMTNVASPDILSVSPPTAYQWNDYLYGEFHSATPAHEPCVFHLVGVNALVDRHPTNYVGGSADNAPYGGVAQGFITTDPYATNLQISVSKVAVHEIGHLTGRVGQDAHDGHMDGDTDPNCALESSSKGAVKLEDPPLCEAHAMSVRRSVIRSWAPHATGEVRRASVGRDSP